MPNPSTKKVKIKKCSMCEVMEDENTTVENCPFCPVKLPVDPNKKSK